jgi:hypothetical protein
MSIAASSIGQTAIGGEGQPVTPPKVAPPTKRIFVATSDVVAQPEPR